MYRIRIPLIQVSRVAIGERGRSTRVVRQSLEHRMPGLCTHIVRRLVFIFLGFIARCSTSQVPVVSGSDSQAPIADKELQSLQSMKGKQKQLPLNDVLGANM